MSKRVPVAPRREARPTALAASAALFCLAVTGPASASPGLACRVSLVGMAESEVRVKVGRRAVTLGTSDEAPQELRVLPGGRGAVLVAWAGRGEHGPFGSSTLFKVPCRTGAAEAFVHIDNADFGHAALWRDGRALIFTGPDGIYTLDLERRSSRRLTRASLPSCSDSHVETRDVVGRFVDRRTLSFERGCSYEHGWNAEPMVLRDPGTPKMTVARAPRPPFASVAVDAHGGVWLADGLCGAASTFNRVLFSDDGGEHWRKVPVQMLYDQPAREVIADRDGAGIALVWSYGCASDAHQDTGWVYVTEDGGRSFRAVAVPPGIPASGTEPAPEQDPIVGVEAADGRVAHLLLYGRRPGGPLLRWESRDAGRTWSLPTAARGLPKAVRTKAVGPDGTRYEIRADGLYRESAGEAAVRIFPR